MRITMPFPHVLNRMMAEALGLSAVASPSLWTGRPGGGGW